MPASWNSSNFGISFPSWRPTMATLGFFFFCWQRAAAAVCGLAGFEDRSWTRVNRTRGWECAWRGLWDGWDGTVALAMTQILSRSRSYTKATFLEGGGNDSESEPETNNVGWRKGDAANTKPQGRAKETETKSKGKTAMSMPISV
ncbi:hypothetical protein B0H63DRAFT_44715 [Podospora didyma]|uniref:Secreted protein n=1 Tax=Podospora didyma TaxID=330526 RepID=A0AAE0P6V6_9PEZI|nr:hypothetical protein B0H63DRAFT_44715 [Podospora didyma]